MPSQFQEISLTPESFCVESEDSNQIDFIFASESQQAMIRHSDSVDGASEDSISAVDDCNDGFRTPTSSDYKIPVVKHCPPAPRRRKPISLSRTLSPRVSGARRGFPVNILDEIVESFFSSSFGSDLLSQRNKKARMDDNHGGEIKL